jgi:hypothetical protein
MYSSDRYIVSGILQTDLVPSEKVQTYPMTHQARLRKSVVLTRLLLGLETINGVCVDHVLPPLGVTMKMVHEDQDRVSINAKMMPPAGNIVRHTLDRIGS